jgi:hypothetical protein
LSWCGGWGDELLDLDLCLTGCIFSPRMFYSCWGWLLVFVLGFERLKVVLVC